MDWTLYWFMFPVAICVTTTASLCGIGGPALFTPIMLIGLPLLGPAYPLDSAVAVFGAALLTQCFGFSSAFVGYARRRLIDYRVALSFAAIGAPLAVFGAICAHVIDDAVLQGIYGTLMIVLAAVLLRRDAGTPGEAAAETAGPPDRRLTDNQGRTYAYTRPRIGIGGVATGAGALLTGMVSVGIGEVMMPLLLKRHRIPVAVAAATSVLVAIITVIAGSVTLIWGLISGGGMTAVPWNLVCYTIPGVIIGGQIGPLLQGRFDPRALVRFIGCLFIVIGAAMFWIVFR